MEFLLAVKESYTCISTVVLRFSVYCITKQFCFMLMLELNPTFCLQLVPLDIEVFKKMFEFMYIYFDLHVSDAWKDVGLILFANIQCTCYFIYFYFISYM